MGHCGDEAGPGGADSLLLSPLHAQKLSGRLVPLLEGSCYGSTRRASETPTCDKKPASLLISQLRGHVLIFKKWFLRLGAGRREWYTGPGLVGFECMYPQRPILLFKAVGPSVSQVIPLD